jgi:ABC-type branched-subunit amino acid transport system permease subunit
MIFAMLVMILMLFFPQGVAGAFSYLQRRFTRKGE